MVTAPTNHHVTITTSDDKQIRSKVVHTQACTCTLLEMHITISDEVGRYKCVYEVEHEMAPGYFAVFGCKPTEESQWLVKGLFARAEILPGGE